jgi:AcrR family transcriptional regulator
VPQTQPRPPRKSQAERTASTRRRALDAAVQCLAHEGYAATTTIRVAEIAQLSRGGMLHHFPTRAGLLSAVLEDIEHRLRDLRRRGLGAIPEDADPFVAVTRVTWDSYQGDAAVALLELTMAARGDGELAGALQKTIAALGDYQLEGARKVAHHVGIFDEERIRAMHVLHNAAMRGLLMDRISGRAPADIEAAIDLLEHYKARFAEELKASRAD